VTVNPYLGRDAVEPFLQSARQVGAGVFVLVRTSNAGAGQFQDLTCDGRPLYQHVGAAVAEWAHENRGACGFGDVGAVVGATYPAELAELRRMLPEVAFLVPGFGAQGGGGPDIRPAFRSDGLGAVINSARGILYSFAPDDPAWEQRVEDAACMTIAAVRRAAGW
jgi:orotidine-5'-phosphate decarboxylase